MGRLFPLEAAISLECPIEIFFVTVSHSLLMIWASTLGFALLSYSKEVSLFPITALESLEVSS